jgi:hypothetical protein
MFQHALVFYRLGEKSAGEIAKPSAMISKGPYEPEAMEGAAARKAAAGSGATRTATATFKRRVRGCGRRA